MEFDVNIWESKWIPRPHSFQVISPKPNDCQLSKVEDLIDPVDRCWKTDLRKSTFMTADTEHMMSIPLSFQNVDDKIVWHYDKKGRFSVKSAYQLAQHDTTEQRCQKPQEIVFFGRSFGSSINSSFSLAVLYTRDSDESLFS
jgi:hypothetical protein